MKHLLTAIACFFALSMSAQSDGYPFNPDSDGDGLVTIEDLLAVLSSFGQPADLETCFRGEAYSLEGTEWDALNHYIPTDCGVFMKWSGCPYPNMCFNRLPIDANNGDVIYGFLRRENFYDQSPFTFQNFENGQWVTFFTFTEYGSTFVKFTFYGGTWDGGIHNMEVLQPEDDYYGN